MSLPEIGEDVENALQRIRELAEEKLDEPKNINIYLANDGDIHIKASHTETDEAGRKEWDCYYKWTEYRIVWKRSKPEIKYQEVKGKDRATVTEEVLDG